MTRFFGDVDVGILVEVDARLERLVHLSRFRRCNVVDSGSSIRVSLTCGFIAGGTIGTSSIRVNLT